MVVHQVERVSGPWEVADAEAVARVEAAARAEAAAPYTVLAQNAQREDTYSDASGFGYCFQELRGSEVRGGRWGGARSVPPRGGALTQHFPTVCVPAARAPDAGGLLQRGWRSLGRSRLSVVLGTPG